MRMMKSSGYGNRTGSVGLFAGRLRQHGGIPSVFYCKHCGREHYKLCCFRNDIRSGG